MSARVEESGIICGERFFFCSALYTCRSARVVIGSQPVHAVTFPSCDIRTATLTASERHAYASTSFFLCNISGQGRNVHHDRKKYLKK